MTWFSDWPTVMDFDKTIHFSRRSELSLKSLVNAFIPLTKEREGISILAGIV